MFCSTFSISPSLSLSIYIYNITFFSQKQDLLIVERSQFWIVEQNIVEHPNSRQMDTFVVYKYPVCNTSPFMIFSAQIFLWPKIWSTLFPHTVRTSRLVQFFKLISKLRYLKVNKMQRIGIIFNLSTSSKQASSQKELMLKI